MIGPLGFSSVEVGRQPADYDLLVIVIPKKIEPEAATRFAGGSLFQMPIELALPSLMLDEIFVTMFAATCHGDTG